MRFYDALADNESALCELSDEILKTIARELIENLHQNLTGGLVGTGERVR